MQTQLRAENGVEEIVIGYYSDPDGPALGDEQEIDLSVLTDIGVEEIALEHLPPELQSTYRAEMHRMRTGEVRRTSEFEQSNKK